MKLYLQTTLKSRKEPKITKSIKIPIIYKHLKWRNSGSPWLTDWLTRFSAQSSPSYASQNCKEKTWHIWSHGHELTFKWSINHVQSGFFEQNRIVKFWKVLSTCFSIKVFIGLSRGCDRVYPPFLWKKIEERHLINLWNRISFSQFENISLSVPTGALYVTMQHYMEANDRNHPWQHNSTRRCNLFCCFDNFGLKFFVFQLF